MATYLNIELPPKRNRWLANKAWQKDNALRQDAKLKGEMFYFRNKLCKNGHNKRYVATDKCVECSANGKLKCRLANPEHTKSQKTKHHLKSNYGITPEEYKALEVKQNYVCAICKQSETAIHKVTAKIKKLAVDHCHDTGRVRGLLCLSCNQGIGKLKHNSEYLRQAAIYCEEI